MTEEIKYIANLQRQEEFDNEVTELKDELKRLEQENDKLKKENAELLTLSCLLEDNKYRKALETIKAILDTKCSIVSNAECVGIINEVLG